MMDELADTEWSEELNLRVQGMADIYHCNFSLFQSLPDVWAIDQLHPIIPLTRLHEKPDRNAVLCDVTCDSDGRIDRFVVGDGVSDCLPLHSLREDEEYYLGSFLRGCLSGNSWRFTQPFWGYQCGYHPLKKRMVSLNCLMKWKETPFRRFELCGI